MMKWFENMMDATGDKMLEHEHTIMHLAFFIFMMAPIVAICIALYNDFIK